MKKPLNVRIDSELIKKIKKRSIDEDKKIYEIMEQQLSGKIYLLLVIDDNRSLDVTEYEKNGKIKRIDAPIEWILDTDNTQSIGIQSISGFKFSEKEAENWALERCKNAIINEEVDSTASEKIIPFEKYIYIDHQCVLVEEPNHWEKHVKFKGFRREGLELPIFGYIELLERPNA